MRRVVGSILLVLGPLSCLVWLGICLFLTLFIFADPGYSETSNSDLFIIIMIASGLILCGLVTLGGWLLAHRKEGTKSRKVFGWMLSIAGAAGIAFSVILAKNADTFYLLLFYILLMMVGVLLLIYLAIKNKE